MENAKIDKEGPEFEVQKQYEEEFKTNYQKMLVMLNKAILHNITTGEDATND